MRFTLSFDMDNSAFEDAPATEAAVILRDVAGRVEEGFTSGVIRDANGTTIGQWSVDE